VARPLVANPQFIEVHRLACFPSGRHDVVFDLMIHDLDVVLSLVDSDVEAIDAVGSSDRPGGHRQRRVRFKNGCTPT
jgi:hypothetical protein